MSTLVYQFFDQYLPSIKGVSNNTMMAYRDTFKLFLPFAAEYHGIKIERCFVSPTGTGHICSTQQGWYALYNKKVWVPTLKRAKEDISRFRKRWEEGTLIIDHTHHITNFLIELWGPMPVNKRSEEAIVKDISDCWCGLSPENLSCDGEAPVAYVQNMTLKLTTKLKALFKEIGRHVGEIEAYELEESYRNSK